MKKTQRPSIYTIFFVLLAGAFLLAACAETSGVSAAEIAPVAVEEMANTGDAVSADSRPSAPISENVTNVPVIAAAQDSEANGYGPGGSGQAGPGTGDHITPAGKPSQAEIEALQFMREEEKLAHDVYQTLHETWNMPVFANIAGSEQAHMDAVAYLLDSYDLDDPAAGNALGQFSNTDLQALYETLIAQGQPSSTDALLVGAAVEEIDILDLEERLAQTDNAAIAQVYNNLLAGSSNHLRAFVTNYERQTGTTYEPQFMSQDAYETLLNATSGRGSGPGANSGGQGPASGGGPGSGRGAATGGGPGSGRGWAG